MIPYITDNFDSSGFRKDNEVTTIQGSRFRKDNPGADINMPGIGRPGVAQTKGHHTY